MRSYLWMNAGNTWGEVSFNDRYAEGGKVYNKALPAWYKRETDARIPIVPTPDDIVDQVPMLGYTMVKDMTPKQLGYLQEFTDFGTSIGVVPEKIDVKKYLKSF